MKGLNKLCMVQFYVLPSPPGNPGDKSSPSDPGVGNCLKRSCPGGRGAGQKKLLPAVLVKYVTSRLT